MQFIWLVQLNYLHRRLNLLLHAGATEDFENTLKISNVIDIPHEQETRTAVAGSSETQCNDDDGSQSDRTMIASDNVMESSSDTSTTTECNASASSFYLKNMLADAMTEKQCECSSDGDGNGKNVHFLE